MRDTRWVATTRCQYWGGGLGPQMNKFEHVSRCRVCLGEGVPYHVTYPMIHVMHLFPLNRTTHACENITFPQLRLRANTYGAHHQRCDNADNTLDQLGIETHFWSESLGVLIN